MSLDVSLSYQVEPKESVTVWRYNITHNLTKMAKEVSEEFYLALWHPEQVLAALRSKDRKSKFLVITLRTGLAELINNPLHYKKFNPPNGWGDYEGLCKFVLEYLQAAERYPNAIVETST